MLTNEQVNALSTNRCEGLDAVAEVCPNLTAYKEDAYEGRPYALWEAVARQVDKRILACLEGQTCIFEQAVEVRGVQDA